MSQLVDYGWALLCSDHDLRHQTATRIGVVAGQIDRRSLLGEGAQARQCGPCLWAIRVDAWDCITLHLWHIERGITSKAVE